MLTTRASRTRVRGSSSGFTFVLLKGGDNRLISIMLSLGLLELPDQRPFTNPTN